MGRSAANIRCEGDRVLLTIDGKAWQLPWQTAISLGRALQAKGRQAEEVASANRIVADQALLLRAGAPFSLTDHPKIRDAARSEAQWGPLRRYLKPRWPSVDFGVPSIRQEKPK